MASLREQRIRARDDLFETIGVRHRERWKTEAEDRIVGCVMAYFGDLTKRQYEGLAELLGWHAVHVKGESRSGLMALADAAGPVPWLGGGEDESEGRP